MTVLYLSVSPSAVQHFSQEWIISLLYLDNWNIYIRLFKSDRALFPWKIHFYPISGLNFLKSLSLVFPGNNLK